MYPQIHCILCHKSVLNLYYAVIKHLMYPKSIVHFAINLYLYLYYSFVIPPTNPWIQCTLYCKSVSIQIISSKSRHKSTNPVNTAINPYFNPYFNFICLWTHPRGGFSHEDKMWSLHQSLGIFQNVLSCLVTCIMTRGV